MQYYLNIDLLPDPEFKTTTLMNALFNKLHRVLVQNKPINIGVSFPQVDQDKHTLGSLLRLHGNEVDIQKLMEQNWLTGMRDHIALGKITSTPNQTQYRVVSRVQAKSNVERLRRRLIKRKGITEEQAYAAISDGKAQTLTLPYVVMKSSSTEQVFRLFIEHKNLQPESTLGTFSTYGLSQKATIPWF
jgi:CRISPR-associated endonuclease Csy4